MPNVQSQAPILNPRWEDSANIPDKGRHDVGNVNPAIAQAELNIISRRVNRESFIFDTFMTMREAELLAHQLLMLLVPGVFRPAYGWILLSRPSVPDDHGMQRCGQGLSQDYCVHSAQQLDYRDVS